MLALWIQHERGEEKLTNEILDDAVASTVNLAEVQSKLVKKGHIPRKPGRKLFARTSSGRAIHQRASEDCRRFDQQRQRNTGCRWGIDPAWRWRLRSRLPVYTTEQLWKNLKVGVPIHVIR
jgi:PIN domain nuclease of toxin-antitoxin system